MGMITVIINMIKRADKELDVVIMIITRYELNSISPIQMREQR